MGLDEFGTVPSSTLIDVKMSALQVQSGEKDFDSGRAEHDIKDKLVYNYFSKQQDASLHISYFPRVEPSFYEIEILSVGDRSTSMWSP